MGADQNNAWFLTAPGLLPPLDEGFRPAALACRTFKQEVKRSGKGVPVRIAIESENGQVSSYATDVFPIGHPQAASNFRYVERIVKFLLWQRGGWRIVVGGPRELGDYIRAQYATGTSRAFDIELMAKVYLKSWTVESTSVDQVPVDRISSKPLGRHLEGCRIGFDLGASDRKVSAVIDGQSVFSEEVVWNPRLEADPQYHYNEIMAALKKAASYMPRVDAIGGSSAGIYVNNSVRVASLFAAVPPAMFESRVAPLFHEIRKAWGNIPMDVINDGEVTALAGSMSLNVNRVLGIAMGSSLAGGYIDKKGNVVGWIDELAFAPVDYNPQAHLDEWSGDIGCGSMYFSQMAVNRLAPVAGIELDSKKTLAERLKDVQALMQKNDPRARRIFETIGIYFGYTVAHYADFYDLNHLLMLGRVTSGTGGDIIVDKANQVLKQEFPEIHEQVKLVVPDEASRRVGQSIAAASLPEISPARSSK